MTFEINFKEDGQLLYGADLMENLGFALTTSLNFSLDGATATNQDNLKVDLFGSDTMTKGGNAKYDADQDWYWTAPIDDEATYTSFDEHDDSSVDPTKWTIGGTGSVTEDTAEMIISAGDGVTAPTATATSIDLFTGDRCFVFGSCRVAFTYGSSDTLAASMTLAGTTIFTWAKTTAAYNNQKWQAILLGTKILYRTKNDGAAWSAWASVNGSTASTIVYSVTGDDQIMSGEGVSIKTSYERYNTKVNQTGDYIESSATTASSTINSAIAKSINVGGTITTSLSADSGSNYESATQKEIHKFTNTGTGLKIKLDMAGTCYISSYAVYYG